MSTFFLLFAILPLEKVKKSAKGIKQNELMKLTLLI